ncbi:hypothetical protein GOBAR_DD27085 [Gossypium barbadense]|nr:hypothetical protein GOBAR_DD27085 [Gossypium barbadense]
MDAHGTRVWSKDNVFLHYPRPEKALSTARVAVSHGSIYYFILDWLQVLLAFSYFLASHIHYFTGAFVQDWLLAQRCYNKAVPSSIAKRWAGAGWKRPEAEGTKMQRGRCHIY